MKAALRHMTVLILIFSVIMSVVDPVGTSPVMGGHDQDGGPRGSRVLFGSNSTSHANGTDTEDDDTNETSTTDFETSTETSGPDTNQTDTSDDETSETTETETESSETDGHTEDSTSHEDEEEDPVKYEVEVQTEETAAEVKTVVSNATAEQQFKAALDFSSSPKVKVEYKSDLSTTSTSTEMQMGIESLTEFIDQNGNGLIDPGEQALQTIDVTSFLPLEENIITTQGNESIYIINATLTGGYFQVIFSFAGAVMDVNGTRLRPTSLKIDFIFSNFPYTAENSSLQIALTLRSKSEVSHDDKDSEEELLAAGEDQAFFAWVNYAVYDGVQGVVYSNISSISGKKQNVYLGYSHASRIVHDPEIGVEPKIVKVSTNIPPESSVPTSNYLGSSTTYLVPRISLSSAIGSTLIATLVFLAIPVLLLRRKEY